MTNTTRDFPLSQLIDWDAPHASNTEVQNTNEWCVFRAPDDGLTYRFYFSPVFADYSEMEWCDDMPTTVTATRVELHQRTVVVEEWLPVVAIPAGAEMETN